MTPLPTKCSRLRSFQSGSPDVCCGLMLSHCAVSDMSVRRVSGATSEFCPSLLGIPPRPRAPISPPHFENFCILIILARKRRIMAGVSHFLVRESNKDRKKTFAINPARDSMPRRCAWRAAIAHFSASGKIAASSSAADSAPAKASQSDVCHLVLLACRATANSRRGSCFSKRRRATSRRPSAQRAN